MSDGPISDHSEWTPAADAELTVTYRRWMRGDPLPDPLTDDLWWVIDLYSDLRGYDILDAGCDCGASKAEYHRATCVVNGIYGELCELFDVWPQCGWNMFDLSQPLHYICQSRTEENNFHVLGEINGPGHWCDREMRWVEHGE